MSIPHGSNFVAAGLSTVAGGLVLWRMGAVPELPAYLYVAAIAGPMAVTDCRTQRIPDVLTLSSYPIVVTLLAGAAAAHHDARPLLRALLAAAATVAFHLLLHLLHPTGLGLGDVKLAGIQGLLCGWTSWTALFVSVALAFTAVASLGAICFFNDQSACVPFAPFVLTGTLAVCLSTAQQ